MILQGNVQTSCMSFFSAYKIVMVPILPFNTLVCTQTHTAPPKFHETMPGSTLAGPPLYLPIHPMLPEPGVGAALLGHTEEPTGDAGGGGYVWSRDRLILNPAAFCCSFLT